MVFSLVTGVVNTATGLVHDVASEIDSFLFGFDVDERERKRIIDGYIKLRKSGFSEDEAADIIEARYGG